jgi:hypothetical protein
MCIHVELIEWRLISGSPLLQEKGSPLPKFGEWDVNDPASAEGFTVIFNKARDEKKTGGNSQGQDVPNKTSQPSGQGLYAAKGNASVSTLSFSFGCPISHWLFNSFYAALTFFLSRICSFAGLRCCPVILTICPSQKGKT